MLTGKQESAARKFYHEHKYYVQKLAELAEKSVPPTLMEDKNSPIIWKAEHWKWFFEYIK